MSSIPRRSGSVSLPYGVTDIKTGERLGGNERKTFAINCTPSLMGTGTSRWSVTSPAMRLAIYLPLFKCTNK